jgi:hypothetical protein
MAKLEQILKKGRFENFRMFLDLCDSYELTKKKLADETLRAMQFWVPDVCLWRMEAEKVILYLAHYEHSPLLNGTPQAKMIVKDLKNSGGYKMHDEDGIKAITNAPGTVRVNLDRVRSRHTWGSFYVFSVSTSNYHGINKEERKLLQWPFAREGNLEGQMKKFAELSVDTLKIGLMGKDYFVKQAAHNAILTVARFEGIDYDEEGRGSVDFDTASMHLNFKQHFWMGTPKPPKAIMRFNEADMKTFVETYVTAGKREQAYKKIEKMKLINRH